MKNRLFALTALVAALGFAACGGADRNTELTPEGIGPVRLGMPIADLPAQVEGLYDTIEIEHVPEGFDDLEYEPIPAYDIYRFQLNGETMFETSFGEGATSLSHLDVVSPRIDYKGIHAGMPIAEALAAGAKCYAAGEFGGYGPYFHSYLKIDGTPIVFSFHYLNGKGFTERFGQKLMERGIIEAGTLDVTGKDFQKDAVIESIQIGLAN